MFYQGDKHLFERGIEIFSGKKWENGVDKDNSGIFGC